MTKVSTWVLIVLGTVPVMQSQTLPMTGESIPQLAAFDKVMQDLMTKWQVPGAALAATRDGRLVFARGYGYADRATKQLVQPDSLFRIASISKAITAAAVLKLIEQGRLQLSTPAFPLFSDLVPLPGYPVDPRLNRITIQNLLEHKGGWQSSLAMDPPFTFAASAAIAFGMQPPATPNTLIRYMLTQPLQYEPGSQWAYSNFGYIVLGQIIERVSGQSYSDYVQNMILTPMKIRRMRLGKTLPADRAPDEVIYYEYPGEPMYPSVFASLPGLARGQYGALSFELNSANAGWIASTIDLLRFADSMNGQVSGSPLMSPPLSSVQYVPAKGSLDWVFEGSLPGTNTFVHVAAADPSLGRISWAVLFNTRAQTEDIAKDADEQLLFASKGITQWPSGDNFSIFDSSTSACISACTTPTSVSSVAGTPQQTSANTVFPQRLEVIVKDTNQNGIPGIRVLFSLPSNGASGSFSSNSAVTTGSTGIAVAPILTANTMAGSYTVTARLIDFPDISATFSFTNVTAPTPLRFVPIPPCRLVDSRREQGTFGGPSLAANSIRDFTVPAGACRIPTSAMAYSLNVAVVPQGYLGSVTIWAADQLQPQVSMLSSDGRIKSTAAVVGASVNGAIRVHASHSTDLVLDINGYFIPASASEGLAFYPLPPCRVSDTRRADSQLGGPYLRGQTARTFPILKSSCNVPNTAKAYSLNFAAVPRGPLGYMSVWPSGQGRSLVASLNALTGTVTANASIIPAGMDGSIEIFPSNDTDLVIDINGYFAPPGAGGLSFFVVNPCRVIDTSSSAGKGVFVGVLSTNMLESGCGGTSASTAFLVSATATAAGPLGYITLWPEGSLQPTVATLNALDGVSTSNMALVPTNRATMNTFVSNPTNLILDMYGYFAP